jgi:hypothetical protein
MVAGATGRPYQLVPRRGSIPRRQDLGDLQHGVTGTGVVDVVRADLGERLPHAEGLRRAVGVLGGVADAPDPAAKAHSANASPAAVVSILIFMANSPNPAQQCVRQIWGDVGTSHKTPPVNSAD